jgi:hypothetical protein
MQQFGVPRRPISKRAQVTSKSPSGEVRIHEEGFEAARRLAQIKAVIGELPTYGYRRIHAILKRQALAAGLTPANHKRVYRVMKVHRSVRSFGVYSSALPAHWSSAQVHVLFSPVFI